METIKFINGTLKMLYHGVSKFDKTKTKRFIMSIASDVLSELREDDEVKECYKDAVMLPKWFKGENDSINLNSLYNIPIMYNNHEFDTMDFIAQYEKFIKDSEVVVKVKFKNGCAYPVALKIVKLGEEKPLYNPFDDFEG